MASNKHHELAKLAMEQVSDLLTNYPIRQANSFVNTDGTFPKLIKFDYAGKYSLKGTTRLYVEAGLEIAADYKYFNQGHTWSATKRKYYISNFGRYRTNLVPYTNDETLLSASYELTLKADGHVDVDLLRHELVHYFLPYLARLNDVNDLLTLLHWHKPTREESSGGYRRHSFIYNWLTVIYLLLTENRNQEAEACLEKFVWILHLFDNNDSYRQHGEGEGTFGLIDRFQKDFVLSRSYSYDEHLRRIVIT